MKLLLFHVVTIAHHMFVTYYSTFMIDFSDVVHDGLKTVTELRWRYMTSWSFAVQTAFFVWCIFIDLIRLFGTKKFIKTQQKAKSLKSFLFCSLVFPLACHVTVQFWTYFLYDREIIYPAVIDTKLPVWFNHSMHTVTFVTVLIEMLLVNHNYPKRKSALICLNVFILCYMLCALVTFLQYGKWVYPMLMMMNYPKKAVLFAIQHIIATAVYIVGERLHSVLWGSGAQGGSSRKKPKSK